MANPPTIVHLITLTILTTLLQATISTGTTTSFKHGIKSMHFTLYQHDTINKTDYLVVPSPLGTNITETTSPFGTIAVLRDTLTLTKDPSSKVIGNVESIAITSSFDGLDSLSIVTVKVELEDGRVKGTLSMLGVVNAIEPSDNVVVGGTKDFLFVQGYVTASPVAFKGSSYVYKQEFHLFWPPYALAFRD